MAGGRDALDRAEVGDADRQRALAPAILDDRLLGGRRVERGGVGHAGILNPRRRQTYPSPTMA
jgi:hypothetical protein